MTNGDKNYLVYLTHRSVFAGTLSSLTSPKLTLQTMSDQKLQYNNQKPQQSLQDLFPYESIFIFGLEEEKQSSAIGMLYLLNGIAFN